MQASVPLFVIRTFPTEGTQSIIVFAISTSSGLGIPKLVPRSAAACTAATTGWGACPRIAGPQVPT